MSSDYIPRLRAELLRADKRPRPVRRAARRLTPVALAVAAVLAFVTIGDRPPDDAQTYQLSGGAQTARVLEERFAAAGTQNATVDVTPSGVTVLAGTDVRPLMQPGRLAIYDWEDSLIGDGPTTFEQARERAEQHPEATAVRSDDGWYVLAGPPALTNADVANARAAKDPLTGQPAVVLDFTAAGQDKFTELTRTLAGRGADGVVHADPLETAQHFAIVVDDRIRSLPFVNWREAPDGIPGAQGAHISDNLNPDTARQLAALLDSGPLP